MQEVQPTTGEWKPVSVRLPAGTFYLEFVADCQLGEKSATLTLLRDMQMWDATCANLSSSSEEYSPLLY